MSIKSAAPTTLLEITVTKGMWLVFAKATVSPSNPSGGSASLVIQQANLKNSVLPIDQTDFSIAPGGVNSGMAIGPYNCSQAQATLELTAAAPPGLALHVALVATSVDAVTGPFYEG